MKRTILLLTLILIVSLSGCIDKKTIVKPETDIFSLESVLDIRNENQESDEELVLMINNFLDKVTTYQNQYVMDKDLYEEQIIKIDNEAVIYKEDVPEYKNVYKNEYFEATELKKFLNSTIAFIKNGYITEEGQNIESSISIDFFVNDDSFSVIFIGELSVIQIKAVFHQGHLIIENVSTYITNTSNSISYTLYNPFEISMKKTIESSDLIVSTESSTYSHKTKLYEKIAIRHSFNQYVYNEYSMEYVKADYLENTFFEIYRYDEMFSSTEIGYLYNEEKSVSFYEEEGYKTMRFNALHLEGYEKFLNGKIFTNEGELVGTIFSAGYKGFSYPTIFPSDEISFEMLTDGLSYTHYLVSDLQSLHDKSQLMIDDIFITNTAISINDIEYSTNDDFKKLFVSNIPKSRVSQISLYIKPSSWLYCSDCGVSSDFCEMYPYNEQCYEPYPIELAFDPITFPIANRKNDSADELNLFLIKLHEKEWTMFTRDDRVDEFERKYSYFKDTVPPPNLKSGERDRYKMTKNLEVDFNYLENLINEEVMKQMYTYLSIEEPITRYNDPFIDGVDYSHISDSESRSDLNVYNYEDDFIVKKEMELYQGYSWNSFKSKIYSLKLNEDDNEYMKTFITFRNYELESVDYKHIIEDKQIIDLNIYTDNNYLNVDYTFVNIYSGFLINLEFNISLDYSYELRYEVISIPAGTRTVINKQNDYTDMLFEYIEDGELVYTYKKIHNEVEEMHFNLQFLEGWDYFFDQKLYDSSGELESLGEFDIEDSYRGYMVEKTMNPTEENFSTITSELSYFGQSYTDFSYKRLGLINEFESINIENQTLYLDSTEFDFTSREGILSLIEMLTDNNYIELEIDHMYELIEEGMNASQ